MKRVLASVAACGLALGIAAPASVRAASSQAVEWLCSRASRPSKYRLLKGCSGWRTSRRSSRSPPPASR